MVADFQAATLKLNLLQMQQLLFDYSADAFNETLVIKPDYDFGNNNLGVYYARKSGEKNLALAEKYFRGALNSNQRYADAYNNLGIILARQGDEFAGKGQLAEAEKKLDDAIDCHKLGLRVRNDRASDHNNLCRVYMRRHDLYAKTGRADKAKEDLDLAIQENESSLLCDPNFPGAVLSRYEINLGQKDYPQAARLVAG